MLKGMAPEIAVLINLRARHGSEAVAAACRRKLPGAHVLASRTLADAQRFVRDVSESSPDLVVSAGGDGTAVALINALRGRPAASAAIGCLRLGTGNGWARDTGAPHWRRAIEQLSAWRERGAPLPKRRFDLIEVEGTLAHYAGTGWDAEMIDDFHAQQTGVGILPQKFRRGLAGYLQALATRTVPRYVLGRARQAEVEITNTGDDAIGVDDEGRAVPLPKGKHGAVLYRGPVSVCGAGTTKQWGFEFKAFPFAGLVPRRFCLRVYTAKALRAVGSSAALWRGAHPIPHMSTFMLTSCRAVYSRPVAFQIGGDRVGHKSEIEYSVAQEQVDLLEWSRLAA
jgi:hypothetical protein